MDQATGAHDERLTLEVVEKVQQTAGTADLFWVRRHTVGGTKRRLFEAQLHCSSTLKAAEATSAALFYKEVISGASYDAKKNGHVLRDGIVELDILKQVREGDAVVALIAYVNMGLRGIGIVLEPARANFSEMYFAGGNYVPAADFLIVCETFFKNVLDFLERQKIVYCDWKFENILCFHPTRTTVAADVRLKLADFGSALPAGVPVPNPRNVNQMFGAPTFAHSVETVVPAHSDDHVSVCYLFYKLNGVRLPWELAYEFRDQAPTQAELTEMICFSNFLKIYKLVGICKASDLTHWPQDARFGAVRRMKELLKSS